uniref:DUF4376 domain-containing protein n=1 Tax=Candidatus Kentrum sp. TC TaxID=2126339 RepID=A0A450Z5M7_9GAMM|nr:MAG: protein of unknown function (DUF4376) [Candidatus Kentron sp. TC]
MRFSKKTGCFYPENISYPNLPPDLIDVDEKAYHAAMNRRHGEVLEVVEGKLMVANGRIVYRTDTGGRMIIGESGPLPDGATEKERPSELYDWREDQGAWALDRDRALASVREEIKAYRNHRMDAGGAFYEGRWFRTDVFSHKDILGAVSIGEEFDAQSEQDRTWRDMENEYVVLTAKEMAELNKAILRMRRDAFTAFERHMGLLGESENPLEYDYRSKWWPESYAAWWRCSIALRGRIASGSTGLTVSSCAIRNRSRLFLCAGSSVFSMSNIHESAYSTR